MGALDPVRGDSQDWDPVLLTCIQDCRFQETWEPDSTHIPHIPGYVSKRFPLVGLLCFKTQACLLNVDGRVSPVGKKVGRGRRFCEGLWACAIGAWSVERAEVNFRQIFTRDTFVLSWLRNNKATGRSSGN